LAPSSAATRPTARPPPTPGSALEAVLPAVATRFPLQAAASPARPIDPQALQRALDQLVRQRRGRFGVAAREIAGPLSVSHGGDERFQLASIYKVILMAEVMRVVDTGNLKLTDEVRTVEHYEFGEPEGGVPPDTTVTVDRALAAMIGVSSNAAALALIHQIGALALQGAPTRFGMRATEIDVQPVSSPGHYEIDAIGPASDLADFLRRLGRGEVVSPSADRRMVDYMLAQQIDDRLPALLPGDVQVAHKTGDLDGFTHDVGIVFAPAHPFAIAVLAEGGSLAEGKAAAAETGRLLYAALAGA
jgi:beta-lactamase class A